MCSLEKLVAKHVGKMTERGFRLLRRAIVVYWVLLILWLTHVVLYQRDHKVQKIFYDDLNFTKPFLLQEVAEWSQPLILDIKILEKGQNCDEPAFTRSEGGSKEYETKVLVEVEQANVTSTSQNETNTTDTEGTNAESSAPQDQTDSADARALQDDNATQNQSSSIDMRTTDTADQEVLAQTAIITENIEALQQAQEAIRIQIENSESSANLTEQIQALQNLPTQISEQLDLLVDLQNSNQSDQEEGEGTSTANTIAAENATAVTFSSQEQTLNATQQDTNTTEDATQVTIPPEEKTVTVKATPQITSSVFKDGTTICLTRSDQSSSYRKFVTVDLSTQACPSGYEPCSKLTDPANTLCVQPGTQSQNCPITDVQVIEKRWFSEQLWFSRQISPSEAEIYEKAVFSGDDDDLDWGLFYSREYNSLPLLSFVFERSIPCFSQQVRRSDSPLEEILDIGVTEYRAECDDEYSGKVNKRYRATIGGPLVRESEWFEDTGIWAEYESLPGKEKEVERLKERKSSVGLMLWAKQVPAYKLECRGELSDLDTFANLIETELDHEYTESHRKELLEFIDRQNGWLHSVYPGYFWTVFGFSTILLLVQFLCFNCCCNFKYKRYTKNDRETIHTGCFMGPPACILPTVVIGLNLGAVINEIIAVVREIELSSDPYFDRDDTIIQYAQCSDSYLEFALEKYKTPADAAPPDTTEASPRAIISILIGFLILPIWMYLVCVYMGLMKEQWTLIDKDFPLDQVNRNPNAVQPEAPPQDPPQAPEALPPVPEELKKPDVSDNPEVIALKERIAKLSAVQATPDEEIKEPIQEDYNAMDPDQGAASAHFFGSPEVQSNNRAAGWIEARIRNPQSFIEPKSEPQD